ncbi:hypothetical protein D9613_011146 [Agrocybe pediades]|uniref:Calcium uniporter protein, mitochondrial n=1 Tax=Agrocybe pediades TaxID=84607 RepID=A0A8H4QL00_9AGAR|nr:hypothetical protein D9613_011146 [Agrocybe pediades]
MLLRAFSLFRYHGSRTLLSKCRYSTGPTKEVYVSHSSFIADSSPRAKWENERMKSGKTLGRNDEFEGVTDTKGKLSPTSSHLFKLILPLGSISHPSNTKTEPEEDTDPTKPSVPPTVILLHPSQPLSHVSDLILGSLAPATPSISFRSTTSRNQVFQWSDSTDLGDFIRDAARSAEFTICISYGPKAARKRVLPVTDENSRFVEIDREQEAKEAKDEGIIETHITVAVPTFADRTRFLRRRLEVIEGQLREIEDLKAKCDKEAHAGARKMAIGGFGMLVVYWATVARLTFWDFGWDVMEPVTYLSGLSMVILGYLWFLYRGREVSYTSVLASSISARREALYKTRGLDIERWIDLVGERKALRAEIGRIAQDYEGDEGNEILNLESDDKESDESESPRKYADHEDEDDASTGNGHGADELPEGLLLNNRKNGKKSNIDIAEEASDAEDIDYDDVNPAEQKGKRVAKKVDNKGL